MASLSEVPRSEREQDDDDSPPSRSWSCSLVKKSACSHTWIIKDFSLRQGEHIKSPMFSPANDSTLTWQLVLYPSGTLESEGNYVSLYLELTSCSVPSVTARFQFVIICQDGAPSVYAASSQRKFSKNGTWGYSKFVERNTLLDKSQSLLPNDTLTVRCSATSFDHTFHISGKSKSIPECKRCSLRDDLVQLLTNGKFSDVTLSVDGKALRAHKAILAARSSVFEAMFEHDMKESNTNVVVIEDMSYEVVTEILSFIYTGTSPNLNSMASDLLPAADKYDLQMLRAMCEEQLYSSMSTDVAVEVLLLAERHNLDELKARVMDYINANATDVVKTNGWQTLVKQHPNIVAELFSALVTRQETSA